MEPRSQLQALPRAEPSRSEPPRGCDGLVGPARASRPFEPGPPDRCIGADVSAAPEPDGCLLPASGLDRQSGLAEPDSVVMRRLLAGLFQGAFQAHVGQPSEVEVAEMPEVADRILRLRQACVVQGPDVIEADLDLIDLTQQ